MVYLLSNKDCCIEDVVAHEIKAGAKYFLNDIEDKYTRIIDKTSGKILAVNFFDLIYNFNKTEFAKVVNFKSDIICVLDFVENKNILTFDIFGEHLCIDISNQILINYFDCKEIVKFVSDIHFSHIEYFDKICVLFFEGKRDFAIIVEKGKILYAYYYDEINVKENNLTLLSRMNDSINHGLVAKIEKGKFDSYLVYLDDSDLNLKSKFCICVFLDCVLARNYSYIKNLLDETLVDEMDNLKLFFDEIKDYYPIDETHCIVKKKDAQMDIFEFVISDNKILNITIVDC